MGAYVNSDIAEYIKLIGGLIAIILAVFTIYDRLFKYRPLISIYASASERWPYPELKILIRNISDKDLMIENIICKNKKVKISPSSDMEKARTFFDGDTIAVVLAKKERSFIIPHLADDVRNEEYMRAHHKLDFIINWTTYDSSFIGSRRAKITITSQKLKMIVEDIAEDFEQSRS